MKMVTAPARLDGARAKLSSLIKPSTLWLQMIDHGGFVRISDEVTKVPGVLTAAVPSSTRSVGVIQGLGQSHADLLASQMVLLILRRSLRFVRWPIEELRLLSGPRKSRLERHLCLGISEACDLAQSDLLIERDEY